MHIFIKKAFCLILTVGAFLGFSLLPAQAQSQNINYSVKMKLLIVDADTNDVVTTTTKNIAFWVYATNTTQSLIDLTNFAGGFSAINLYPIKSMYQTGGDTATQSGPYYTFNVNSSIGASIANITLAAGQTKTMFIGAFPINSAKFINLPTNSTPTSVTSLNKGYYLPTAVLSVFSGTIQLNYSLSPEPVYVANVSSSPSPSPTPSPVL